MGRARPDDHLQATRRRQPDRVARLAAVHRQLEHGARGHESPASPDSRRPGVERERAVRQEMRVGPDGPDRNLGRHLVGPGDDRQPIAEVQEAVPLDHRRVVEAGCEGLGLERLDLARDDVRGDLRVGQRKMSPDDKPTGGPAAIGPIGEQDRELPAQPALGRAGAGERDRRPVGAEQGQVAEHVLAVLGPDHDERATRRVGHRSPLEIRDIREQVAPLRRQQVDEIDVLGGRLEQRRRWREEVNVAVGGDPAPAVEVDRPVERELEAAGRWIDLDSRAMRGAVEPTDDLHLDDANREVDREAARDVGVGRRSQDQVAAVVLVEPAIHLVAMADGRQVATIGSPEADPAGGALARSPVDDLDLDRHARRREQLDRPAAAGFVECMAREQVDGRDGPIAETERRVGRQRQVDDPPPGRHRLPGRARRAPANDRRGVLADWQRGRCRLGADDRPEVEIRRVVESGDADLDPRAANERARRSPEQGDRGDDHVAAGPASCERFEAHGDGLGTGLELDRVEPQQRIAGRARDVVRHADLVRAIGAGHDRQGPRVPRRRVATGALGGVRPAPVDDLVGQVRDRRERPRSPAEDPVVDLEPPPDDPAQLRSGAVHDRVARQRLADRDDVPDRQPGRPRPRVIAPRIAEVCHDDVTRRPGGRKLDRRRPIQEDPATGVHVRPEVEREALEHLASGRQAAERASVFGMEPGRDLGLARVPGGVQIDRLGEWAGGRHRARFRSADDAPY